MKKDDARRIIDLKREQAKAALLKSESYFDFDLPPYFDFMPMLLGIDQKLTDSSLQDVWTSAPRDYEAVNHIIYHSKDGQYAWRPQELIHPAIYVAVVDALTSPDAWTLVQEHFRNCATNNRIECVSHPVISTSKQTDKASQVLSWWLEMEQRSLELSLDFEHVLQTDISDCYGSLYTHTISWALHGKALAKSKAGKNDKSLLGNRLDFLIASSRHGQTNGIPQGSNMTNLIAEIVLGYADAQLSKAISGSGITEYKVLRYRDDYRVFCNNPAEGHAIVKMLTEVLQDLGMKLSAEKTAKSDQVVQASIKEDKLFWIGKEKKKRSLIKHMLLIHQLSLEYPNSGSVAIALSKFQKRISKLSKFEDPTNPILAVATDVAIRNPRVYPVYAAILSTLFSHLDAADRQSAIGRILRKFEKVPNCGHLHVWMQRFAVPMDIELEVTEPLCQAFKKPSFQLWNSDWLPVGFLPLLEAKNYIDEEVTASLKPVIDAKEVQLFGYNY